ncbi:mechanosensitive ion channel family protein [uncultured Agathobaculum sp.]|uniref:mechanosensitive ion channel family protein n=1 Tax=uncultured Agathobaculum sp. TaxID=2048140 RepID=UPI00260C50E8|nr:mechanosensitive ion channel family protein [uncultured Agathobaculum sp.]
MLEWVQSFLSTEIGAVVGSIVFAIVVLAVTHLLARIVNRVMRRLVERHRQSNSSLATILGFVRYIAVAAVYFAGVMVVVYSIPLLSSAVRTLLTAGGVIAVVAGLAAQEALGSVVSGMMILAFKPFRMGDVVRYIDNDISGVIEEITLHHTAIRTWENKRVIIPNSKMNSSIIENADYADSKVCVFMQIGVTYESNIDLAKKLLAEEIQRQPDFMDVRTPEQKAAGVPQVQVVVLELADSAVTLRASLWAKDNSTAFSLKCSVLENIKKLYEQNGIDIAYPHMVVMQK